MNKVEGGMIDGNILLDISAGDDPVDIIPLTANHFRQPEGLRMFLGFSSRRSATVMINVENTSANAEQVSHVIGSELQRHLSASRGLT